MTHRQTLGILGAAALAAGVFMPIVAAPVLGDWNYYRDGHPEALVVLALAGISLVLGLLGLHFPLLLTGLLALGTIGYTYFNLRQRIEGLGLLEEAVQLRWGWSVLLAGGALLLLAAVVPGRRR